jgi:hypothetical protein
MAALLITGCRKDLIPSSDSYVETVKQGLKDSLSATDFLSLDFTRALRSKVDSVNLHLLRIPLKGKTFTEDFVIVKTNIKGLIERGKIVHQEGKVTEYEVGSVKRKKWDGSIRISSLDRKTVLTSPIENGYITALHSNMNARSTLVAPDNVMPEVIITYIISKAGGGYSWSSWMNLQSYFYDNGGGSWGNYYGSWDEGGGGSGGGSTGSGDGNPNGGGNGDGPANDNTILVDFETYDENPEIDIEKYINCFSNIPDAGATCSIELFTDIPVDSDPNKIFDIGTRSPGHTFIQIKKSNGNQSAIQNIGFYPKSGFKTILTNAPVDGKFVDNGMHEYNASLFKSLNPEALNSTLVKIQQLARFIKYDVDDYNCTDFALDVFNKTGYNINIPLYDIPGNYPSTGTRMPVGVYNKLRHLKTTNDPQAAYINMDFQKGFTANSSGPCN